MSRSLYEIHQTPSGGFAVEVVDPLVQPHEGAGTVASRPIGFFATRRDAERKVERLCLVGERPRRERDPD